MVGVSVILNRTVVDSDWRFKTCAVVIFRVKVNCITSVDSGLAGITELFRITRDLPCQKRLWILGFSATSVKILAFFVALNHLSKPLRKQFNSTGSKGRGSRFVIGEFWSLPFCVFLFQGSLLFNFRVRLFWRFNTYVFLTFLKWQVWIPKSRRNTVMREWKQISTFPPTFGFAAPTR